MTNSIHLQWLYLHLPTDEAPAQAHCRQWSQANQQVLGELAAWPLFGRTARRILTYSFFFHLRKCCCTSRQSTCWELTARSASASYAFATPWIATGTFLPLASGIWRTRVNYTLIYWKTRWRGGGIRTDHLCRWLKWSVKSAHWWWH